MKSVLITGYAGQDGYWLAEILSAKGYVLYGLDIVEGPDNVERVGGRFSGGIMDFEAIRRALETCKVEEIYHLAAVADPKMADTHARGMVEVNVMGTLNVLEAVRRFNPKVKVLYVGSDNVFGEYAAGPQSERTALNPTDFYGATKAAGLMMARVYRRYGLHVAAAIPFNHSSAVQKGDYLLVRVAREVVRVCRELAEFGKVKKPIEMKSRLDVRDFLHARDVAEAMVLIMEKGENTDYVIGSGMRRNVYSIVKRAYELGAGLLQIENAPPVDDVVVFENARCGTGWPVADIWRLSKLGWKLQISFDELIEEILEAEIKKA